MVWNWVNDKNNHANTTFVDFIAEDLCGQLSEVLKKVMLFLFLVVYFDLNSNDGAVHVRNRYLCVRQPIKSACTSGLVECFESALSYLGLDEEPSKLIGFGCDGANVNMGEAGGVKGRPWVIAVWCFAHRLELAIKDALKKTYFSTILLRVYYIYHKSLKKCRELEEVVCELKACLDSSDFLEISLYVPVAHGLSLIKYVL